MRRRAANRLPLLDPCGKSRWLFREFSRAAIEHDAERCAREGPRRVDRRQRRVGFGDEQRDFGATQHHTVTPTSPELLDQRLKITPRLVREFALDQLVENDPVDSLPLGRVR